MPVRDRASFRSVRHLAALTDAQNIQLPIVSSDAQPYTMASAQDVTVPFIKKKGRSRPTTTRQRSASPGPAETSASSPTVAPKSEVVLPSRKNANRLIRAGTKRTVSKRDEDDAEGEDERDGPDVKWTAEKSHINAAKEILLGDEAEELLAKRRKAENPDGDDEDVPEDGLYRGQKGYTNHIKRRQEVPKAMRVGPQRNTSTIRTVTIVDYQPDVCKDYKGEFPPRLVLWIPGKEGADITPVPRFRDRLLWFRRHVQVFTRQRDM